MSTSRPVVAGIGYAFPQQLSQQDLWHGFFSRHYGGIAHAAAARLFEHSGVVTRHGAVSPLIEDVSGWSTGARMTRYLTEALPLALAAALDALAHAALAPAEIGLLVVCSCTGYATPGLDILLARDLGLASDARRLFVGHMGCYAALPGLGVVSDYVSLSGRSALLVCVELPSLHVQPPTADLQQVVSHALFSDAAAAVVIRAGGSGRAVIDVVSVTDTSAADQMSWHVTDHGFRLGLAPTVPQVLARHVQPLVTGLLARHSVDMASVAGWAVHPGGPRILTAVAAELGLGEAAIAASREVLAEHGNCSSPTVLLILDRLLKDAPVADAGAGSPILIMAFGPGLTLFAGLLG